ncbi:UbiA prenyltransferase family protein [Candidatus Woesearchaeota archaeon]|nr:UbiA prenyltransferase family protein [Candidatus Woesearchaeota archaeon]
MSYLELVRAFQWYKNFLVALALVFSGNLLNFSVYPQVLIAFAAFCALSSSTYVLNDIADRQRDALHPEKRSRPLPSGRVSVQGAFILSFSLASVGVALSLLLPVGFVMCAFSYFVLSQLYTLLLKHEAFADILTIAVNFVLRAVGGAFAIQVWVSPWLIVGVFFLALFLAVGKRKSELLLLKEKAISQRKALGGYTAESLSLLSAISTTTLIISYVLYAFFGGHEKLFITLPPALYAILRYASLIEQGSRTAREPQLVFKDKRMLIAMALWLVLALWALY